MFFQLNIFWDLVIIEKLGINNLIITCIILRNGAKILMKKFFGEKRNEDADEKRE